MLKSVELDQFKSYGRKTQFDIKPLTILCGVNSSGKSSLIKSLLLLKQSYENSAATNEMTFNDQYCNCGSFKDVIFNGTAKGTFFIKNAFEIARGIGQPNDYRDLTSYKELKRMYRVNQNASAKFKISSRIEVARTSNGSDALVTGNRIKSYNISVDVLLLKNGVYTSQSITEISLQRVSGSTFSYDVIIENLPSVNMDNAPFSGELEKCACYFSGVSLTNMYKTDMEATAKNILANLFTIFRIVSNQYREIKFIAPLRESPKRYYISDKNVFDVGIAGENTVLLLAKEKEKTKGGSIDPIKSEDEFYLQVTDKTMLELVQGWMQYFELGELTLTGNEILQLNVNNHNIVDVGFGVSQTLPIIVQAIVMRKNETLLLEQPEIHLHPQMQMRMADFLMAQAMSGKNMIVETHSDHIVNRICRRLMENPYLMDNVEIYFMDKDDTGSTVKEEVIIDKIDGITIDNPKFFYQFASETEKIIDIGYRNMISMENDNGNNSD